jgi:hypothetical protein
MVKPSTADPPKYASPLTLRAASQCPAASTRTRTYTPAATPAKRNTGGNPSNTMTATITDTGNMLRALPRWSPRSAAQNSAGINAPMWL